VVTTNNAVHCKIMCGCSKNRLFGGTYRLHHHGQENPRTRNKVNNMWQVLANVLPVQLFLNIMMETMRNLERQFLHEPHGVTIHKTSLFKY
jgi:hypothetical protein